MNFQNLNFDHVEAPRMSLITGNANEHTQGLVTDTCAIDSWQQYSSPSASGDDSQVTIRPHQAVDDHADYVSQSNSISPQPTVVPRKPSPSTESASTPESYGHERYFGPTQLPAVHAYNASRPTPTSVVRFDEAQLALYAADNASRMAGMKDELTLAAGKVTPGVDDSPYIRYAIDALTRDQGTPTGFPYSASTPSDDQSKEARESRRIVDEEMGHAPVAPPKPAHWNSGYGWNSPVQKREPPPRLPPASPSKESKLPSAGEWVPVSRMMRDSVDPIGRTHPPLVYKPHILRPFSMMILMTLCILMMAGLIFSAVYSARHSGLTPYPGSIYSGQYFVFRILPQLLASVILLYAQSIVTASMRILPFAEMASEDPHRRYRALFQNLYPRSFLWPQFVGPWQVKAFNSATWLTLFTIPIQSSAFTCTFVHGKWVWAASQGVIWTLIAIYALLVLSTAGVMVFWFGQWTGLMWDMRSIADLLPLLNRSNTTETYGRMNTSGQTYDFNEQLRSRWFDRLGYWRTENMTNGGIWYAIGASSTHLDMAGKHDHDYLGKRISDEPSFDSKDYGFRKSFDHQQYKYLPWCLRTSLLVAGAATAGVLLLGLLIVSFLPQTRLSSGFVPLLPAGPTQDVFSAANFLYSFLPSLLGMIMFLLFQSIDQALRRLQPWSDLSRLNGAVAQKSILADYAACLPFESAWKAVRNRHWRVAVVSLAAGLWIFIPILAGGLFMALTDPSGQVRMFPNMPVFGVLLAFLSLYVGCLFLMLVRRSQFMLPHAVTSVAQIISLCSAKDLVQDAAFRSVRSRQDLEARLGARQGDPRNETAWFLGIVPGRDEHLLSVRRLSRFTEKRSVV